jgi:predicted hydrocarbon binding protein
MILDELAYQEATGSLAFRDVRYLLIRPDTLATFQLEMVKRFGAKATGEILYSGGYQGGSRSGIRYREEFNFSVREAIEFMCKMGGQIGWGNFWLRELESDSLRVVVEVGHSPFAEGYPETPLIGVCHFTRGVLGGLMESLFEKPVRTVESKCVALGDPLCRFEIIGVE